MSCVVQRYWTEDRVVCLFTTESIAVAGTTAQEHHLLAPQLIPGGTFKIDWAI